MILYILEQYNPDLMLYEEIRYYTPSEFDTAVLYLKAFREKYKYNRYRLVGVCRV